LHRCYFCILQYFSTNIIRIKKIHQNDQFRDRLLKFTGDNRGHWGENSFSALYIMSQFIFLLNNALLIYSTVSTGFSTKFDKIIGTAAIFDHAGLQVEKPWWNFCRSLRLT
jgi:hypothetical protein